MAFLGKVFNFMGVGRYSAAPVPVSEGGLAALLVDQIGRLQVALGGPAVGQRVVQLTGATKGPLKAGSSQFVEIGVWNQGAIPVWFQVFNKATLPADGDIPVDQIYVPAGGSQGARMVGTLVCPLGLQWAASSTPGVLTTITSPDVGFTAGVL